MIEAPDPALDWLAHDEREHLLGDDLRTAGQSGSPRQ